MEMLLASRNMKRQANPTPEPYQTYTGTRVLD